MVTDDDNCPINTPAVAAAYVIKKYTAIASDEISFEVVGIILFYLFIIIRICCGHHYFIFISANALKEKRKSSAAINIIGKEFGMNGK